MKILIGVPTYKRPTMLQRALNSVAALEIPADLGNTPVEVTMVIVDNDPDRSAYKVVDRFSTSSPMPVRYATSEKRGIGSARNSLIDQALLSSADFCAWIDDDEMVRPGWLKELLTIQQRFEADVVAGPVNSLLPPEALMGPAAVSRQTTSDGNPPEIRRNKQRAVLLPPDSRLGASLRSGVRPHWR